MDKEVCDRYYRVLGRLEALEQAALHTQCMPNDRATIALLETARVALNKAVTSAWEYAEQSTAVSATVTTTEKQS